MQLKEPTWQIDAEVGLEECSTLGADGDGGFVINRHHVRFVEMPAIYQGQLRMVEGEGADEVQ